MRSFLARVTTLRPIACGIAVGLILVGVLALVGGRYDRQVIHDQLAPQKIFFPKTEAQGLFPDLQKYAGQQVVNGDQAKAYANQYINRHLEEIAGGKTYAEVSAASLAAPKDAKLAGQTQTLFRGETLRGLLLNAWGWGAVATIATLAGITLLVVGILLLALPLLDLALNPRRRRDAVPVVTGGAAGGLAPA